MAEPVIVPVTAKFIDVDTSELNFGDVEKEISKSMTGIKKAINDAFSGIDPSAINKPIEAAMTSVKKSVQAAEAAQLRYNEALIRAGTSTEEYKRAVNAAKSAIANQQVLVNELSKLGPAAAPFLAEAQKELDVLIEERNKINPIDFVDKAQPIQLEKVAHAYKKVLSATENIDKQSEKFNQTVQDNRLTEEYNTALKQLDEYQKKLEDLEAKSVRMEALGATDRQWETMRYDVAQVSNEMENLVKSMEEMQRAGKALRFGGEMTPEDATFPQRSMWKMGATADKITERAKSNQSPYTEEYQKALDELEKLEKKVESIKEKSAKMVELGASKKQFEGLVYDAENIDGKIDAVQQRLVNMASTGNAFKFGDGDTSAEITKILDKSDSLQTFLLGGANDARKAQGGLTALGVANPKLAAILTVVGKVAVGFGKVLSVVGKVTKTIVSGFGAAAKVLGKVGSVVRNITSGFVKFAKGLIGGIKNLNIFGKTSHKTTNNANTGFKKLTRNIMMFGLGFRTAYYAVKRLRNIFVEGFTAMAEKFDEVGKPLVTFTEALNRLKGSLATAFQPIASVVMPLLTRFMNYMSGMLEAVGKFTAVLTGQGYIYKTIAKDINSVSQAAKKANNQLGSYDKLEVIQQNDAGYDYEKQEIGDTESAVSNFANMVKEAWENADFTSVGKFVSDKLIEVLDNVETQIVPMATELVNKVLKSVNTFLDGFDAIAVGSKVGSVVNAIVDGVDWAQLGALFANLYNVVWEFFDGLANNLDWEQLGESVATGVSSLFNTLNLDSWVGMISGLANGITTALSTMFDNIDWASVATKFGNALNGVFANVNMDKIGTTINKLVTTIWTTLGSFFETVDTVSIATKISELINNIFGNGSGAFDDAVPNIADSLVSFVTTLLDEIDWNEIASTVGDGLMTIIESLGKSLSESDNSVFSSIGKAINNIVPALESMSAIMDTLTSIAPILAALLPPITEVLSAMTQMLMPLVGPILELVTEVLSRVISSLLPPLLKVLQALQPMFDAISESLLPFITRLFDVLLPLLESVLGLVSSLLAPIVSLIGPLLDIVVSVLDPILSILEPFISVIGTICDVLGLVLEPILTALLPIFEAISSVFQILRPLISVLVSPLNLVAGAFKAVAGILSSVVVPIIKIVMTVIEALMNVVKMLGNVFTMAFGSIQVLFQNLGSWLRNFANSIISVIESFVNGIIKGLNSIIKAMNTLSFDIPDWIPVLGGKKFGFNIREVSSIKIPRLAQGAVIPPNKEFLAMLGDQKHGTNIEAPLDTIKQALAEVLAEVGGGTREPIVLQVSGRTLAKVVWDEQEKRYKQTGKSMA